MAAEAFKTRRLRWLRGSRPASVGCSWNNDLCWGLHAAWQALQGNCAQRQCDHVSHCLLVGGCSEVAAAARCKVAVKHSSWQALRAAARSSSVTTRVGTACWQAGSLEVKGNEMVRDRQRQHAL
jgi:hypothetical protein